MSHTVTVRDHQGNTDEFTDATWHIDDRGQLHIKDGDTQLASYARDGWDSVTRTGGIR